MTAFGQRVILSDVKWLPDEWEERGEKIEEEIREADVFDVERAFSSLVREREGFE